MESHLDKRVVIDSDEENLLKYTKPIFKCTSKLLAALMWQSNSSIDRIFIATSPRIISNFENCFPCLSQNNSPLEFSFFILYK